MARQSSPAIRQRLETGSRIVEFGTWPYRRSTPDHADHSSLLDTPYASASRSVPRTHARMLARAPVKTRKALVESCPTLDLKSATFWCPAYTRKCPCTPCTLKALKLSTIASAVPVGLNVETGLMQSNRVAFAA